jgi:DNA-binding MarR family transcriptional regulator
MDLQQLREFRDTNIARLMQRATRALITRLFAELHARGYKELRVTHSALLANLEELEGTRISVLAERAGITKQAMGQLLVELEAKGYVQSRVDPTDKRAKIVSFTAFGWQMMLDTVEVIRSLEAEYAVALGERGIQVLRTALNLILDEVPPPDDFSS